MYITEAFKALNALNEDTFSLNDDGIRKLSEFEQNDDLTDEISVIDPKAETEDDLQDSYVGKVILDCSVCHSKLYKDKTEVTVDEEQQLANVGEECPYCYTSDGFKVLGEVAPFKDEEEEETESEEVKEDEPVEEPAEDGKKDDEEDLDEGLFGKKKQKSSTNNSEVKKQEWELFDIITSQPTGQSFDNKFDAEKEAAKREKDTGHVYKVQLRESVNNVNVETDDSIVNVETDESGKVVVTTEPKTELANGDEMLIPLEPETETEILNNDPEAEDIPVEDIPLDDEVEMDIDEFDEESFDELGESYLKNIYENVNSYKTTKVVNSDNKLKVEGVIKFNSGNEKKTSFVFESKDITKDTVKFIGENLNITRGKKAFTVKGKVNEGKFISESLNYNYKAKDDAGKSTRIYGTVRTKGVN